MILISIDLGEIFCSIQPYLNIQGMRILLPMHQKFEITFRKLGNVDKDISDYSIIISTQSPRAKCAVISSYFRALERFRDAYIKSISDDELQTHYREIGYSALLESLAWARVIVNCWEGGNRKFPDQKLALALFFARNQTQHSWDELIDLSISEKKGHIWLWSNKNHDEYSNCSFYHEYTTTLMGKEIIGTLDEFSDAIWPHRGWKIKKSDIFQPGVSVQSHLLFDID